MKPEEYAVPRHPTLASPDLAAIMATPLLMQRAMRFWPEPNTPRASALGQPARAWLFTAGMIVITKPAQRDAAELEVVEAEREDARRRVEESEKKRGPHAKERSVAGTALHVVAHVLADSGGPVGLLGLPVLALATAVEGVEPEVEPMDRALRQELDLRLLKARLAAGAEPHIVAWPDVEHAHWRTANRWIVPEYFMSLTHDRDDRPSGCTWAAPPEARILSAGEAMLVRLRHEIAALSLRFIDGLFGAKPYAAFAQTAVPQLRDKHAEAWPFAADDLVGEIQKTVPAEASKHFVPQTMLRTVSTEMAPLAGHYARIPACAPVIQKLQSA